MTIYKFNKIIKLIEKELNRRKIIETTSPMSFIVLNKEAYEEFKKEIGASFPE